MRGSCKPLKEAGNSMHERKLYRIIECGKEQEGAIEDERE